MPAKKATSKKSNGEAVSPFQRSVFQSTRKHQIIDISEWGVTVKILGYTIHQQRLTYLYGKTEEQIRQLTIDEYNEYQTRQGEIENLIISQNVVDVATGEPFFTHEDVLTLPDQHPIPYAKIINTLADLFGSSAQSLIDAKKNLKQATTNVTTMN